MSICCLFQNGKREVFKISEAVISANDASFLFGDGIYEVIGVVNGNYVDLTPHLVRMEQSAEYVLMRTPLTVKQMEAELQQLLVENKAQGKTGIVYIQLTRGNSALRNEIPLRDFLPSDDAEPTLMMWFIELPILAIQGENQGERSLIFPEIRWSLRHIKTTQLMASRLAKMIAKEHGCNEPIYINQRNFITEGGSTNIFIVKGNILKTHPADCQILAGITRMRVIELAKNLGYETIEGAFTLTELFESDEVFRTSTTMGVKGITGVKIIPNDSRILPKDIINKRIWQPAGKLVGDYGSLDNRVGPVTLELAEAYRAYANGTNMNEVKYNEAV